MPFLSESGPAIDPDFRTQMAKIIETARGGDYVEAERLSKHALELQRGAGRPVELIEALHAAGQATLRLGQFENARKNFTEELELSRASKATDPAWMATAWTDLGELSVATWDYEDALNALKQAESLCDQRSSEGRLLTNRIRRDQAEAEIGQGEFEKAEGPIQAALEGFKNEGDSEEILATQSDLAELNLSLRKLDEAEALFRSVLEQRKASLGEKHPETARSQVLLGYYYYVRGNYAAAEPLFLTAIETLTTALGADNPKALWADNYEGMLMIRTGRFAEAQSILQRVLDGRLKCYGEDSAATAETLNNLAATYYKQNNLEKTADLLRRSLQITENKSGESLDTADTAGNLGRVFQKLKKYDEAEKSFVRSLKIRNANLPPGHPDIATSESVLAKLYDEEGKFAQAEPLWTKSISEMSERLGPLHRDLIAPYQGSALNQLELGHRDKAIDLIRKYSEASEALLANVLIFTTEEERLEFTRAQDPFSLLVSASLAEDLANAVLRWKGIVLDSLLEDTLVASQESDPAIKALAAELKTQYAALQKVPRGMSGSPANSQTGAADTIHAKIDELQKRLALKVNGYGSVHRALKVTYQEVQSTLTDRVALVEFLRCQAYQGKGVWQEHYGALIVTQRGTPKWVDLGDAKEIDAAILQFREAVAKGPDKLYAICRQLYDLLVNSVVAQLPAGVDELIVSPDGELNFLPLAVLLTPNGKFLCQRYAIGYVASGRDLLRPRTASPSGAKAIEIFANPDFDLTGTATMRAEVPTNALDRGLAQALSSSLTLGALPGSSREAALVQEAAEKSGISEVHILEGDKASKPALFDVKSPWVLHLATHALVLSEQQLADENPMHRCALAFAGAQRTLRAWATGDFPAPENDGIVLADEVSRIPLVGTWLVTLSACQTGMGEADVGEGVLGLRRGFAMAGAENLLLTLWQISDSDTADFMSSFYRLAFTEHDALLALAESQRNTLVRLRQEESLGAAIQKAGPFVLTVQAGLR